MAEVVAVEAGLPLSSILLQLMTSTMMAFLMSRLRASVSAVHLRIGAMFL
jgi:hypothetical protein